MVGLVLLLAASAMAEDIELTYQGRLLDTTGNPVDGSQTVTVQLYGASDTNPAWTGTFTGIPVEQGYFSVVLGSNPAQPLSDSVLDDRPVEVALSINGGVESSPRQTLLSVPYAARASSVSEAGRASDLLNATCSADGVLGFDNDSDVLRICLDGDWRTIWSPIGQSQSAPGASCKGLLDGGNASGNGVYWIDPNGGATTDAFQVTCDMDGGGWTELKPEYASYSWKHVTCGGSNDPDCRPNNVTVTTHQEFGQSVVGTIAWLDHNGVEISAEQLSALTALSTESNTPGTLWVFDHVNQNHDATFQYNDGTTAFANAATMFVANTQETWFQLPESTYDTFAAPDGRLLNSIDIRSNSNWGVFVHFSDDMARLR